ncbi:MAG: glucose-6-phosphate isomerase [Planctomycetota bacterium]
MSELATGDIRITGLSYRCARSLVGPVDEAALQALPLERAAEAFQRLVDTASSPGMDEPVAWPRLGEGEGNGAESLAAALAWAEGARGADVLISVGIGGSYLGNRVLRDALLGTRADALPRAARGGPQLLFAGQHLDPLEARQLVEVVRAAAPARVALLSISKSGTTTETLATTLSLTAALQAAGIQPELAALTAPGSILATLAAEAGGALIPFPEGIGGRWCVLSPVGLATAAATGVDTDALLAGARTARGELLAGGADLKKNPALLYAALHHLHGRAGRTGGVFMPYAERLRCVSEWYVQLLAESLGKERDRQGRLVHAGRTPIVAVGTTDMHAQTQQHQEGAQDKTVTTVDVADWGPATAADRVPELAAAGKLAGKTFAALNTIARESNEEALASSGRPSDAFVLDRLDARTLGAFLYTLMASVSYEGELLDVCAYDQPGVEAYKKIMKTRL